MSHPRKASKGVTESEYGRALRRRRLLNPCATESLSIANGTGAFPLVGKYDAELPGCKRTVSVVRAQGRVGFRRRQDQHQVILQLS
jgi:hypothetical protein